MKKKREEEKKKSEVLILKKGINSIFFTEIEEEDQYYRNYFNVIKKLKILRKIITPISPLFSIYFGKWKKHISEYDKIILFDQGYDNKVLKYIRKKNQHAKIIFWYWNSVKEFNNCSDYSNSYIIIYYVV